VAEFTSLDAGAIEPESRFAGHVGSKANVFSAASIEEGTAPREARGGAAPADSARGPQARGQAELSLPPARGGMTPRRVPAGDRSGNFVSTPQTLAAARTEAARSAKFDRSRYEIVRSLDRLNAWIERARDTGMVAIDAATESGDPMEAELCGFSL